MERQRYKADVTPGREMFTFSEAEVCKGLFFVAEGRFPTVEQLERLCCWHSRDSQTGKDEWSLSLEDLPPIVTPAEVPS